LNASHAGRCFAVARGHFRRSLNRQALTLSESAHCVHIMGTRDGYSLIRPEEPGCGKRCSPGFSLFRIATNRPNAAHPCIIRTAHGVCAHLLTAQFGVTTPVALTVWDHQGATSTVILDVTPQPSAYPEMIVDGDFAVAGYNDGSISSAATDLGWFGAFATLEDDAARLDGQYGFAWAGQAMYDDHVRRGQLSLSFDYAISEGHTSPGGDEISRLHARVWGINSGAHARRNRVLKSSGNGSRRLSVCDSERRDAPAQIDFALH